MRSHYLMASFVGLVVTLGLLDVIPPSDSHDFVLCTMFLSTMMS